MNDLDRARLRRRMAEERKRNWMIVGWILLAIVWLLYAMGNGGGAACG